MNKDMIQKYIDSRKRLVEGLGIPSVVRKEAEEGGCGVVGFCCTEPVRGRHIHEPSKQMHNRGNGKGGGIAAVGFVPEQLGVSREVLDELLAFILYMGEQDFFASAPTASHLHPFTQSQTQAQPQAALLKGVFAPESTSMMSHYPQMYIPFCQGSILCCDTSHTSPHRCITSLHKNWTQYNRT